MPLKNNVTRLLDSRKIPYTTYQLPAEKVDAIETARLLDVDPFSVYKTIVVACEKSVKKNSNLVVIPGPAQVDLKALASLLRLKKVYLTTQREAEIWTGLQVGGISPLALLNKGFRVFLDASALEKGEIHISGGQRGLNIRLPVDALIKLTNAQVGKVSHLLMD
jgi:Cys-tRNA(Pro)/Cys-tRNA(Cys) deacylase